MPGDLKSRVITPIVLTILMGFKKLTKTGNKNSLDTIVDLIDGKNPMDKLKSMKMDLKSEKRCFTP